MQQALSIDELQIYLIDDYAKPLGPQSLDIGKNVALLGKNGSGKTSLTEALVGLRKYRGGASILNSSSDNISDADKRMLGVQFQAPAFDENYRVGDLVRFHESVYPTSDKKIRTLFDIDALLRQSFEKLSTGQKRRVSLFLALAHGPKLVFLDEPSAGLDTEYCARFHTLLTEKAADPDTTIVISTHNDDEARIADETWLISRGSLLVTGAPQDLVREKLAEYVYSIAFADATSLQNFTNIASARGCKSHIEHDTCNITVFADRDFQQLVAPFLAETVLDTLTIRPTLISDIVKYAGGDAAQ